MSGKPSSGAGSISTLNKRVNKGRRSFGHSWSRQHLMIGGPGVGASGSFNSVDDVSNFLIMEYVNSTLQEYRRRIVTL